MDFIDFKSLQKRCDEIKDDFYSKKPFRYTMLRDSLMQNAAELIYSSYPQIKDGKWDGTTYIDQKNKFQKTTFETDSVFDKVFSRVEFSRISFIG